MTLVFLAFALSQTQGRVPARVVATTPADFTPAEQHAAVELSDALTKMGQPAFNTPVGRARIHLGWTLEAQQDCKDIDPKSFGPDGFLIREVKDHVYILGGRPRGVLNGVHRLLNLVGVRWWTPWAAEYPRKRITFTSLNLREEPTFEYRDPYWHAAFQPEWASRNVCNGFNENLRDEHGGGTVYEGFVHTYYALVDPKERFGIHPEWFSLIDGKRTAENAQLCTTNPELRKYVLEQVRTNLRNNPKATIVSVSQNDCFNPCQCDVCQALAREQGSQAAPVIALANYVADGIKDEFPNVAVDTLAYQWSRHAPKSLKPKPNVIVRLCSIEGDFGTPLDRGRNATFAKDIRDWSQLTKRLYIWDYCTNFANYMQPMPDYLNIGPNLRFFAANGGKGVFEEGDYNSEGGEMAELKNWLMAQLLWNPQQDDRKLTDEFLRGYYGEPAAPSIRRYVELMAEAAAKSPVGFADRTDKPYLAWPVIREADRLWIAAELATKDPVKLARIKRNHLGIQYVILKRWDEFRKAALADGSIWTLATARTEAAQQWLAIAKSQLPDGTPAVTAVDEGGLTPEAFVARL